MSDVLTVTAETLSADDVFSVDKWVDVWIVVLTVDLYEIVGTWVEVFMDVERDVIVVTWPVADVTIDVWVALIWSVATDVLSVELSFDVDIVEDKNVGDLLRLFVDTEVKVVDGLKVDSIEEINVGISGLYGFELEGGSKVDIEDEINVGTSELTRMELIDVKVDKWVEEIKVFVAVILIGFSVVTSSIFLAVVSVDTNVGTWVEIEVNIEVDVVWSVSLDVLSVDKLVEADVEIAVSVLSVDENVGTWVEIEVYIEVDVVWSVSLEVLSVDKLVEANVENAVAVSVSSVDANVGPWVEIDVYIEVDIDWFISLDVFSVDKLVEADVEIADSVLSVDEDVGTWVEIEVYIEVDWSVSLDVLSVDKLVEADVENAVALAVLSVDANVGTWLEIEVYIEVNWVWSISVGVLSVDKLVYDVCCVKVIVIVDESVVDKIFVVCKDVDLTVDIFFKYVEDLSDVCFVVSVVGVLKSLVVESAIDFCVSDVKSKSVYGVV